MAPNLPTSSGYVLSQLIRLEILRAPTGVYYRFLANHWIVYFRLSNRCHLHGAQRQLVHVFQTNEAIDCAGHTATDIHLISSCTFRQRPIGSLPTSHTLHLFLFACLPQLAHAPVQYVPIRVTCPISVSSCVAGTPIVHVRWALLMYFSSFKFPSIHMSSGTHLSRWSFCAVPFVFVRYFEFGSNISVCQSDASHRWPLWLRPTSHQLPFPRASSIPIICALHVTPQATRRAQIH